MRLAILDAIMCAVCPQVASGAMEMLVHIAVSQTGDVFEKGKYEDARYSYHKSLKYNFDSNKDTPFYYKIIVAENPSILAYVWRMLDVLQESWDIRLGECTFCLLSCCMLAFNTWLPW